jgi:iron complex outermembrane receptor protein
MTEVGIGGFMRPMVSRTMVLINGRQVYFDAFGEVFWQSLPVELDEIRQIEVIKGPQSALYGFNAVDGVVNIITFDPVNDAVDVARSRLGNHAMRDFSASVTQPFGDGGGVRLTAADGHMHDFGMPTKTPGNTAFEWNPNRRSASLDAGYDLPDGSRLSVEASHSDVTGRTFGFDVYLDARIVTDSVKGSYTADTGLGRVNATAYFTQTDLPWVRLQSFSGFDLGDRDEVAQLSDLFKIGNADSFRLGVEARHSEMGSSNRVGETITGDSGAGSVMWDHAFSPELSAVNAVRYDYYKLGRNGPGVAGDIFTNADFDRSLEGASVNSAVVDKITDLDNLRLSFGRGLYLPSLSAFGQLQHFLPLYSGGIRGVNSFGNPDLPAPAVYDYQAGWDRQISELAATARINVFHDMTMKYIGTTQIRVGRIPAQLFTPTAGSVTNGLSFELQHKATEGWLWGGNYTYQRVHEHIDLGLRDGVPVNKANVNIGYGWGRWEADMYGSYVSATKQQVIYASAPLTTVIENVPGHVALAPRLAWHAMDALTVELVANNLWSYKDSVAQGMDPVYLLSVRVTY